MSLDITSLKSNFKGDIITPSDSSYDAAIARWAINAQRRAAVVAFVKDESDVALAIKFAKGHKLPIAIKGGGHNPAAASSSEGGLVIDLSKYLNGARVDPEERKAYVGGGALWEAVDKEAIKHGLATVAGTVNHTGVGGLVLGGGYGWLSAAHGLAIDNLLQATVVTADGSVLTANHTTHPDLFFGIRGGGSNFGVVTEFVLQLHPQRSTVYAGLVIFPPQHLEKIVEFTANWYPKAGKNEGMTQMLGMGPDGNFCITTILFFNGTEAEGRANFKAFLDIGPVVDMTKEIPYGELNGLLNAAVYHGQGIYMKGIAHRTPHFPSISRAFSALQRSSTASPGNKFLCNLMFEYFPLSHITSVPQHSTAFRRDPTPSVLFLAVWPGDEHVDEKTERARTAAKELADIILEGQKNLVKGHISDSQGLGYGNYDSEAVAGEKESVPDKARAVFAENYPRLQAIKKRYDPENVFSKWFPVTPA